MNFRETFAVLGFCIGMTVNVLAAERSAPEVTVDGLYLVDGTEMALVYAKPGVDLSQYDRFYVVEPQVAFEKNWLKDQNAIPNQYVRPEDMQRIKSELAALFTEVFKQELQNNGGYKLADAPA